jgi:hypothetical protein
MELLYCHLSKLDRHSTRGLYVGISCVAVEQAFAVAPVGHVPSLQLKRLYNAGSMHTGRIYRAY